LTKLKTGATNTNLLSNCYVKIDFCNWPAFGDSKKSLKDVNGYILTTSVAEPHHFYAAPAPSENFDAAPAPAPTVLHSKAKFLKRTKV
jgi:hypothetical protein